jgi:hypothetical protein
MAVADDDVMMGSNLGTMAMPKGMPGGLGKAMHRRKRQNHG